MASAELIGGDKQRDGEHSHVVELDAEAADSDSISEEQVAPLLSQSEKPKINIFSVSYPKRRSSRELITRVTESETSSVTQLVLWAWSGSRYSGLLCMVFSSTIYCIMEALSDNFSAQSIPLFEIALTRCTVILILSFIWLRRSGHPIFGPTTIRSLLVYRAISGYLSLMSFVYCIQRLPLTQAIAISFTTPIMASIMAKFILHEKLKIAEMGALSCSFFGVLFIFRTKFSIQAGLAKPGGSSSIRESHHIFSVLIGLFSSLSGGISYCLIRAAAKASEQPVVTVFSFAILACPAAALCTYVFEDFVLPSIYSFILMIVLGILAFVAEVLLARGLQLEKLSKVVNILYLEVALLQLLGMGSLTIVPTFGRMIGCLLILVSACCTLYIGPEKETETETE